ncbi:MAG: hypothetical protein VR64_21160 [Desulfatitalea sp. BRH_c12]|nr:MAG: hypothetical protein VR64_21160 [Desulfatitalea sp. BRH_c12]
MKRPLIIGVMGAGRDNKACDRQAYRLGALIAAQGWILLNGGRNAGIMAASARGAAENGGLTVGVLPDADTADASPFVRIPICTGMGSARNTINVLSSDFVVACRGGAGTVSEIALALKHGKPVITLDFDVQSCFEGMDARGSMSSAQTPEEVIEKIKEYFGVR